jgi:hypothetical protein
VYEAISVANDYQLLIKNLNRYLEHGNYDVSTLRNDMNDAWNDVNLYIESTTAVERKQGKYVFMSPDFFIFNAKKSNIGNNLGFSTIPESDEFALYEAWTIGNNTNLFAAIYNTEEIQYKIFAPGLVNLLGERFLILRCKEIEDHLLGSLAYTSYTQGVGIFKLAASYNDVTNLRFDFVSLVRKPFHPIGKLSKLTFRFEMSDGRLYDFKGVNHQMLLMVKYMVPTQKMKFERSVLNPNYDSNFLRYMNKHMGGMHDTTYNENSEEEEEFDTTDYYQQYKKEFEKHDYSTSEEEDDYDETEDSEDFEFDD